jgi:hypothetical protein
MTMLKSRLDGDYEFMKTGFQVPRDKKVVTARQDNQLDDDHQWIRVYNTLPSVSELTTDAGIQAGAEQKPFNDLYHQHILGSHEHTFTTRIHHPLFDQEDKYLPPWTPFKVRIFLHPMKAMFQCRDNHVPRIEIKDAHFIDHLIKIDEKLAESVMGKLLGTTDQGEMKFPIIRRELQEHNITRSRVIMLNRAFTGTLPRRIFMKFVPTATWQNMNSAQNGFLSRFPGLTKLKISYGMKDWPSREGFVFKEVPNTPPPYTDEEKERMQWANHDIIRQIKEVFVPAKYTHTLAWTSKDFFENCAVFAVDLTPLQADCEMKDVLTPRRDGDLTIRMEFSHEIGAAEPQMLLTTAEHNNMIVWSVPTFEITTDF